MKQIPLSRAYMLLQDCSAVQVDDGLVAVPSLMGTDNPDGEFMHLVWSDTNGICESSDSGYLYEYYFNKDDNETVTINGATMTLVSTEDEEITLTLLMDWNVEEWIRSFTE